MIRFYCNLLLLSLSLTFFLFFFSIILLVYNINNTDTTHSETKTTNKNNNQNEKEADPCYIEMLQLLKDSLRELPDDRPTIQTIQKRLANIPGVREMSSTLNQSQKSKDNGWIDPTFNKDQVHDWIADKVITSSLDTKDNHIKTLLAGVHAFVETKQTETKKNNGAEEKISLSYCGPAQLARTLRHVVKEKKWNIEFGADFN